MLKVFPAPAGSGKFCARVGKPCRCGIVKK